MLSLWKPYTLSRNWEELQPISFPSTQFNSKNITKNPKAKKSLFTLSYPMSFTLKGLKVNVCFKLYQEK